MKNQANIKQILYRFFLFATACMILFACTNNKQNLNNENFSSSRQKQTLYKKKNFDTLIQTIIKQTPRQMDVLEQYLDNKAFVEVFDHSLSYFPDVKKLLATRHFSAEQAFVCILAMQNLCIHDYLELCNIYLALYDDHMVSEQMLEAVIAPNFLNKIILKENNDNPDVLNFLNSVLHRNISIKFRKLIEELK
ncbi:hypothetical protein ACFGVS_01650 [Mucilaginibacter sp. AW1-7]|uniref:hypothetical protein n=1 Tax=Mucilaginibacter sp. AW1-7 TaxID=3349874 RepID=UPI003F7403B3